MSAVDCGDRLSAGSSPDACDPVPARVGGNQLPVLGIIQGGSLVLDPPFQACEIFVADRQNARRNQHGPEPVDGQVAVVPGTSGVESLMTEFADPGRQVVQEAGGLFRLARVEQRPAGIVVEQSGCDLVELWTWPAVRRRQEPA